MRTGTLRVVILGMMGRCPFGGQTWFSLGWLRGFQKLGHEVWYVEDDSVWPYDPAKDSLTDDCSYAVQHVARCMGWIGLRDRWAFRFTVQPSQCWGLSESQLKDLYRSCDMLVNFGQTDLHDEQLQAPFRIYIESDPVTSELRLANGDENTKAFFNKHHVFFTNGENYGAPDCRVPLNGMRWERTPKPVDVDLWPFCFNPDAEYFTTIGNYRQEGLDVEYMGEVYRWSKHHEWEKFISLPKQTTQPFELAMMPNEAGDRERFQNNGWRLTDPFLMSLDVFGDYQSYIRRSRGEFTVAKDQYVRLRSGWFSERGAAYLASGKPVVAQDTGFPAVLPTGEGLFAVGNVDEAAAAIEEINHNYPKHCKAARGIAEEYFDARKVVERVLARL